MVIVKPLGGVGRPCHSRCTIQSRYCCDCRTHRGKCTVGGGLWLAKNSMRAATPPKISRLPERATHRQHIAVVAPSFWELLLYHAHLYWRESPFMELSTRAIQAVVHPTAAFPSYDDPVEQLTPASPSPAPVPWEESLLNPRNRIDSLDLPAGPLWRVDGCTGVGTQYYTVPLFLSAVPPMRMDVFIPEDQPAVLREQLQLDVAFHTKDAARLSRLAIARHIIRTLHHWVRTDFESLAEFERFYSTAPFGTRLVIEQLSLHVRNIHVTVGLNHNLERQLLPATALTMFWGPDFPFPSTVDFHEIQVLKVLHDSVCLVRIHSEVFIFKALTSGSKYLYHELKTLCTLASHPNVISRPVHIVKKVCSFGAKKAIAGFTTRFQPNGGLRDVLPQLRIHGQLHQSTQLKWCIQLATALEHLRHTTGIYYPDLRLDNIVLSDKDDLVMVDFEQRGVWCEFAAPEVNSLEYIRLIATDEEVDEEVSEKYRDMLERLVPGFEKLERDEYLNPPDGYNVPWIALSPREQEAAEVYMLGRVLWCIFEGVSGPQKAAVWQSYPWESDLEFPDYCRTPPEMRLLIDRCTRGRRQTLNSIIVRRKSHLVLKDIDLGSQSREDVLKSAREYWASELQVAEEFLETREQLKAQGKWDENYYKRPTLTEVLDELADYQGRMSRQ
jgi:hypothetical protein